MSWFFIALFAPALWSATNHIDKYLLGRYFQHKGTGALIIFSSLIGLFVLPVILLFQPNVLGILPLHALLIMGSSIISLMGILAYLYALGKDEASIVVPLFQTIPVFAYILGFVFLDETLTVQQIIAALLIVAGAIIISLSRGEKGAQLKGMVLLFMLIASFFIALGSLIFKFVAIQADFWTTSFWMYVGNVLMGAFFLVFIQQYRNQFVSVVQSNRIPAIGLNGLNEVLDVMASLSLRYATLLAPLALVWTVNGFQPFFVLLYGVILTLFFPHIGTESLLKKHLIQKLIAITLMFAGVYLLNNV